MFRKPNFLSLQINSLFSISTFNLHYSSHNLDFRRLFTSIDREILLPISQFDQSLSSPINPNPNPNSSNLDLDTLCAALKKPNYSGALDDIQCEPSPSLLPAIFKRFESSPKHVFSLFKWAEKRPGYDHTPSVFNSMVNILTKSGEFKWALMILLDKIKNNDGSELISADCFGFLVRNYARLGMSIQAIRLYEFAKTLDMDIFDVLLDGLCKNGNVEVACDCVDRKMCLDPNWVPSIDVYNVLLEGWFRLRNLRKVEQLLLRMRQENLVPGVVTYGVLVCGYCRMGLVGKAVGLIGEMRRDRLTPSRRVYDPLVDALAGAGRLKEALGMLERFLVLEAGPTLTTYNSLVRGFCKAEDVDGAGKILRMMSSRGVVPTATTYNHFFRYFSKCGKIEEGMSLYRKMIESGYEPNETTFHLMLGMLCEDERLELVVKIREDMRSRKRVLNSDMSDVLMHQFCEACMFKEAVMELEEMIERGCIPKLGSYQMLRAELKRKGLHEMAIKVSNMVTAISCSKPSSSEFVGVGDNQYQRRKSIIQKAKVMSNILKAPSDPKKMVKGRRSRKYVSRNPKC
ncbi:hypothetical protein RND81_03G127100 [Saponaria officinalis]|uniref:Pentatricopeptide repeat-containing protein n=1 Tax=Saponaria officinalis TaxID=3572 RepID=A0AAW1M8A4_SAPOF